MLNYQELVEELGKTFPKIPIINEDGWTESARREVVYERRVLLPAGIGAAVVHALHMPHEYVYHSSSARLGEFNLLNNEPREGASASMEFQVEVAGRVRRMVTRVLGPFSFDMFDVTGDKPKPLMRFDFWPVDDKHHLMWVSMYRLDYYLPHVPLLNHRWLRFVPAPVMKAAFEMMYRQVLLEDKRFIPMLCRGQMWRRILYATSRKVDEADMLALMDSFAAMFPGQKFLELVERSQGIFQDSLARTGMEMSAFIRKNAGSVYRAFLLEKR